MLSVLDAPPTAALIGAYALRLPSGETAFVDAADQALVDRYRWFALACPHTTYVRGYLRGQASRSRVDIVLHRLLIGPPDGLDVDHRDRNGLNNRRSNLRACTRSENNGNTLSARGSSGYRGVSWHKQLGKWRAHINLGHRQRYLGVFLDPWEAAQAYNVAALEQWGEFATLNERRPS